MSDPCKEWVVGGSGLAHSGLHNPVGSGLYTAADLDGQLPHEPFSPGGDYLLPHRDAATPFFP